MELSVEKINVDIEYGSIIITGFDVDEVVSEIGYKELLAAMDYADIMEWVAEQEKERASYEADLMSMQEMGK